MHTDPTNAARVRPEQTDAKTLTRSQNEYESITFEQCCEQVPNETKEQIADLLTKPLDKTTFLSLRTLLMTGSNEVP